MPDFTGQFSTLLASRVLQALGGAMMTVIAPAMLSYYLPGDRRAKGMSLVVLFAAVGMALGPTLGGYLTEYLSWHWIFFINVPIGIFAVLIYAKLKGEIQYLVMTGVALIAAGFFLRTHLTPVTGLGVIISALALIGLGLGLTTTPLTTLIMNAAPASKLGIVSSLTGLERFAPMTIGAAVYNIIFMHGIMTAVHNSGITEKPPGDIAAAILSHGFDLAFVVSVILAAVLFLLCIFIREDPAAGE